MTDRRFSEEEFAEILRRATQLQSRALVRTDEGDVGPARGMSLEDIKGIAGEVGIDPALIERAANIVAQRDHTKITADKYVLADSVPGGLTDEDKVRLLQAIRDATAMHGTANVSNTGLEWTSPRSETTQYNVSVHNLDGRNEVRVGVDRSVAAVLSHFFPTMGGFLTGVAISASIEPTAAVGLAIIGLTGATGFTAGRTLWHVLSRKARAKAEKVLRMAVAALPGVGAAAAEIPAIPPGAARSGGSPGEGA